MKFELASQEYQHSGHLRFHVSSRVATSLAQVAKLYPLQFAGQVNYRHLSHTFPSKIAKYTHIVLLENQPVAPNIVASRKAKTFTSLVLNML
jgi:hypothetical protein